MSLSREERQALQQIEERLAFDDPDLDAFLSGAQPPEPRRRELPAAVWWAIAVVAYVVFLIGVVLTVTSPPGSCQGPDGRCDNPAVRTSLAETG
jgi:hypothetical protein